MDNIIYIGQWQGFFKYGPEYGGYLEGKEVEFRLFIENYLNGEFTGRVIDWEGIGSQGEFSKVKGFFKNGFLSFTKEYSQMNIIDEWGNTSTLTDVPGHTVVYEGNYDDLTKSFHGSWEISFQLSSEGEFQIEEINTGTWRMMRHN